MKILHPRSPREKKKRKKEELVPSISQKMIPPLFRERFSELRRGGEGRSRVVVI